MEVAMVDVTAARRSLAAGATTSVHSLCRSTFGQPCILLHMWALSKTLRCHDEV